MPGHRDTTVSITTGPEVAGLEIKEVLIESIWPGIGEAEVTAGTRTFIKKMLALAHYLRNGGSLEASEQFVTGNTIDTN